LQCPELQLLDGSFTAAEFLRDLAHASLIDEAANDDLPLVDRKAIDKLEQHCPLLDSGIDVGLLQCVGRNLLPLAAALPSVRQHFGCDAEQPGGKRLASPFEALSAGKRLMKRLRRSGPELRHGRGRKR
jgi:hypothetical protein